MRLTKAQKRLVLEMATYSSMTTGRWRHFVPLSNKGLAEISEHDSEGFAAAFGVSMRSVVPTEAGKALAQELMSDASLWQPEANAHAERAKRLGEKRCPCVACVTAWKMRPVAA